MPGKLTNCLIRGRSTPEPAPIPKYIMPSSRPWNWPPDWPIATRDQIAAGLSPEQTPGSTLLKGKGLPRNLTVGELSELMKQEAVMRRETRATQSAQHLDRYVRKDEMRGAELFVKSSPRGISNRYSRAISENSEEDVLSPSSSEDETIRMDPGIASDMSSDGGSSRSDVVDGEDGECETEERENMSLVLLRLKNVRRGREGVEIGEKKSGFSKSWSSQSEVPERDCEGIEGGTFI